VRAVGLALVVCPAEPDKDTLDLLIALRITDANVSVFAREERRKCWDIFVL
jgi:hypothetical protein